MADSVIVQCTQCRTKNRIPKARLGEAPLCGRCRAPLPAGDLAKVVTVTDGDFNTVVLGAGMPAVVDCWAPWCGPCRAVAPILDDLARQFSGRVRIFKLNLDENPATGARFHITSVPTLLLVKDGQVVRTLVGAQPREAMEAAIGSML